MQSRPQSLCPLFLLLCVGAVGAKQLQGKCTALLHFNECSYIPAKVATRPVAGTAAAAATTAKALFMAFILCSRFYQFLSSL